MLGAGHRAPTQLNTPPHYDMGGCSHIPYPRLIGFSLRFFFFVLEYTYRLRKGMLSMDFFAVAFGCLFEHPYFSAAAVSLMAAICLVLALYLWGEAYEEMGD